MSRKRYVAIPRELVEHLLKHCVRQADPSRLSPHQFRHLSSDQLPGGPEGRKPGSGPENTAPDGPDHETA